MPPRQLAAELKRTVATAECCCSYNMLKLTRHLYSWNPDPRYFDYFERTMMNERIGTIRPDKGYTQYYLSLTPGAWKTFNTEDHSFWCCTGTGVEEYAKLNDSIYWQRRQGPVCEPVHPLGAGLGRERFQAAPGKQISRAAEHHSGGHRRQGRADIHAAPRARSGSMAAP